MPRTLKIGHYNLETNMGPKYKQFVSTYIFLVQINVHNKTSIHQYDTFHSFHLDAESFHIVFTSSLQSDYFNVYGSKKSER